jgi:hypothetical protein
MFFHHGNFPKLPHHNSTELPGYGAELLFGLCVGQELEKARERLACSICGDRECDRCHKCHKEKFGG